MPGSPSPRAPGRRRRGPERWSSPTRRTTSARIWPGANRSTTCSVAARAGCCSPGRRSAPTPAPIPGVRYDRERPGRARRLLHVRARGARPRMPPGGVHRLRRHAVVAEWRRRDRGRVRHRAHRPRRRAGATERRSPPSCPTACRGSCARPTRGCGSCAGPATPTPAGWSIAADSEPRPADRGAAARGDRPLAGRRSASGGRCGAEARRVHALERAMDRGREHGLRGRRHPAAARRRLRDRGEDAARSSARSSAGSCARSRPPGRSRAGCTSPPIRCCATTPRPIEPEVRHALRRPGETDGRARRAARARGDRAHRHAGLRAR